MKLTKKTRRHSGWIYPSSTIKLKPKKIISDCLEPQPFWDDWMDYRDGVRGYDDRTKLRTKHAGFSGYLDVEKWNRKIRNKIAVRKKKRLSIKNNIGRKSKS